MRADSLTEQFWPRCPENSSLCSELFSFSKARSHQSFCSVPSTGKSEIQTILRVKSSFPLVPLFPLSLLEKHHPVENEPKAGLTPSLSPRTWNKSLGRVKWEFSVAKRTHQLILTPALTIQNRDWVTYCCTACVSLSISVLRLYKHKSLKENTDPEWKCHYKLGFSLGFWPITDVESSNSFAWALVCFFFLNLCFRLRFGQVISHC